MSTEIALPREVLEAPFPQDLVKTRPGAFGNQLSYLEGHSIVARLNEAFDGAWSFEICSHQILDEEVLVCAKLRAKEASVIKMSFGSSSITRDRRTGNPTNLGDDLKAASTDALKKAATLLGVGLYLYGGGGNGEPDDRPFEEELRKPEPRRGNGQNQQTTVPGNGRITNKQISAIFAISRERGMSNADVRSLSKEMFDRNIDYISKIDASRMIEHLLDGR